ncbi:MAG: DUF3823 domain-containing protein [Chitinophagaceae bacterium]|nr:MAG: DUF3823 domain-containing protein [Chitinophagaceae bacterium]
MKTKIFYFLVIVASIGCQVDNYPSPKLTLSGAIVDSSTGQSVPSSGSNGGSFIEVFQGSSGQPLLFNTRPDGTFENSRVFPGNYKIVPIGPFSPVTDTFMANIETDEKINFKVIPNVTLTLSVLSAIDSVAQVKISFNKANNGKQLLSVGVVWSTYPFPNVNVFPGGKIIIDKSNLTGAVQGERSYTLSRLDPKNVYYVRAFALTQNPGSYYNYSVQDSLGMK